LTKKEARENSAEMIVRSIIESNDEENSMNVILRKNGDYRKTLKDYAKKEMIGKPIFTDYFVCNCEFGEFSKMVNIKE
jgi:hypothetical protein